MSRRKSRNSGNAPCLCACTAVLVPLDRGGRLLRADHPACRATIIPLLAAREDFGISRTGTLCTFQVHTSLFC